MFPFLESLAVVLATLCGPILAIQIQKYLERQRSANERRQAIFRTLMSTRAARLSGPHVEALNAIDLEFYEKKRIWGKESNQFRRVRAAWNAYLDQLCTPAPGDKNRDAVFQAKRSELFTDLLYEMALALGYDDFDKTYIKNKSYMPQWFVDIESEETAIRKGLVGIVSGNQDVSMRITSLPNPADSSLEPPPPLTLSTVNAEQDLQPPTGYL